MVLSKNKTIKDVVLAVTYRCNARCRMCSIWQIKDHQGELTPKDYKNLPKGLKDINISGGEPFLRPDLAEIIKVIADRLPAANIIISTNAFATDLINKQMKKIIKIKPNIGVAISLDGIGAAHNNIRRVKDGYQKVINTVRVLRKIGIKNLKFGFTIGDYNICELEKVYKLADDLKMELSTTLVHSSEAYFGQENKINKQDKIIAKLNWLIIKELSGKTPKQWARAYYSYGMKRFVLTGKRILPDYSGKRNIFIDPFGNIYPCDVSSQKIGNLRQPDKALILHKDLDCAQSWMMCTVRPAIKKHWLRAGLWIIYNKLFFSWIFFNRKKNF